MEGPFSGPGRTGLDVRPERSRTVTGDIREDFPASRAEGPEGFPWDRGGEESAEAPDPFPAKLKSLILRLIIWFP